MRAIKPYLFVGANLHTQVKVYQCLLKCHLRIIESISTAAILSTELKRFRPYRCQEGMVVIDASMTGEGFAYRVFMMSDINQVGRGVVVPHCSLWW